MKKFNQKSKVKQKKDTNLLKALNSKITYVLLLAIILIFSFLDDKILNEPQILIFTEYLIAAVAVFVFLFSRVKKFPVYYKQLIKGLVKVDIIIVIAGIVISTIILKAVLSISTSVMIRIYSKKNPVEYYNCDIKNVITTNVDKVHFIFLNKKYSRYFNVNGYERRDLIDNYYLRVGVKKSLFNTYYLESADLQIK